MPSCRSKNTQRKALIRFCKNSMQSQRFGSPWHAEELLGGAGLGTQVMPRGDIRGGVSTSSM